MMQIFRHLKTTPIRCCLILPVLFLSLPLPAAAVTRHPVPGSRPAPRVTVETVTEQDVNPPRKYVGHTEALQAVDLRARVEGFIEQVKFKEGADVREGDLLYILEQAPYQAAVAADRARVDQAKAELYKARRHLKRLQKAKPESVPATDLDNAKAHFRLAEAGLDESLAVLNRALIDIAYTTIRAPINGRIGRNVYTVGNLVNPASGPLARIVQLDPIRVVYSVSENDLTAIQAALADARDGKAPPMLNPRLKLANGDLFRYPGRIDFVDNTVDPATGTFAVRARFANPDRLLLPGQYVTVLIRQSRPRILPVIPQAAVQQDQKGAYVLLVDSGNQVVQRRIRTGPVVGALWAVTAGLKPGERVITEGLQKVRPAMTVVPVPAGEGKGG